MKCRAIGEGAAVSASVIALRVSVAEKSGSPSCGGNRDVRPLGPLVPTLSIVRKLGRTSCRGFQHRGLLQATATYNNAFKRRRAKTHAP